MTSPDTNRKAAGTALVPGQQAPIAVPGETSAAATASRERAIVEARALVALHRPRDFEGARLRLLTACKRPGFARQARYAKPVGDKKTVEGLSIRFAEEARVLWGNMDVSASCVFDSELKSVYRIVGLDLESNASDTREIVIQKTVERKFPKPGDEVISSRQNSRNETTYLIRANEDALLVKENAQIAKARREVILSLIPADIKDECEQLCIDTMKRRDAEDPEGAKRDVLEAFFKVGVMPAQVATYLGHPVEAITPAELVKLRTVYTSLRDGEATWAEIMETVGKTDDAGAPAPEKTPKTGNAALKEKMKKAEPTQEELLAEDQAMLDAERQQD